MRAARVTWMHAGKVRGCLFHSASQFGEPPGCAGNDFSNRSVHRRNPEVRAPGHAKPLYLRRLDGFYEIPGFDRERNGRSVVLPGDHRKHKRRIPYRSGHGAFHGQGVPSQIARVDRHQARRGAESNDPAERGGNPEGPSQVASGCQGAEAAGQGHRRAPAGAPAGITRLPGIPGGAEDLVVGIRPGAELGSIRFPKHDGSRRLESLDDEGVLLGNEILEYFGPPGCPDSCGRGEVLHGHRDAVKAAEFFFFCYRLLGLLGRFPGLFGDHCAVGV